MRAFARPRGPYLSREYPPPTGHGQDVGQVLSRGRAAPHPVGSRTTAGSRRTAPQAAGGAVQRSSSGTEVSVWSGTSLERAQVPLYRVRRLLGARLACAFRPRRSLGLGALAALGFASSPPRLLRMNPGAGCGGREGGRRPGAGAARGSGSRGLKRPADLMACRTSSGTCRRPGVPRRSSGPWCSRIAAGRSCCRSGGTSASCRRPVER